MHVFNWNFVYYSCQILQCGGNLYDIVSLAVKAALFNTKYALSVVIMSRLLIAVMCTCSVW